MKVGILGGGQLGRMLALAGYPLGLRFRFLDPKGDAPARPLGEFVRARFDDLDAVAAFVEGLDVVTWEFENVPISTARFLAERVVVRPGPAALEQAQDRLTEKKAFQALGIPRAPCRAVDSRQDLLRARTELRLPAVLKTRRMGYDGKGQRVLATSADVEEAWEALGGTPLLLEGLVPFERELSIVGVRGRSGETRFYPLVENDHEEGILVRTRAPAEDVPAGLQKLAEGYLRRLLEAVDYVGVMALELFQVGEELLANEMAPRVHNSGHWTQEGARTSQFENHLRAVLGLPLGETEAVGWTAMVNLIGRVPSASAVLRVPGAHLHLYDKAPRKGRKVGHVNVRASDVREGEQRLRALTRVVMPDGVTM